MECENCGKNHNGSYGSGRFCTVKCSRSYSTKNSRKEISKRVSQKLKGRKLSSEHIEKLSGDNNPKTRGKNLPPILEKECPECRIFFRKKSNFCSVECWTNNNRKNKTEWQNYQKDCQFKFNVYDYPEKFQLELIEENGWYSASNRGGNMSGVSRDHMFSVKEGFRNGVDPKLISHPANCELMLQNENSSKKTKCSITLEELKERIENF